MKLLKNILCSCICCLILCVSMNISSEPVCAGDEETTDVTPTFEYSIPQRVKVGYDMSDGQGLCGNDFLIGKNLPIGKVVGYESNMSKFSYGLHLGDTLYYPVREDGTVSRPVFFSVIFRPGEMYVQPCYAEKVGGSMTEEIGKPYIITIEEPLIVHNIPDSVNVGEVYTFSTELTNTELINKKLCEFPYIEKGEHYSNYYEAGNPDAGVHEIVYRPVIDVIEGENIVSRTNQDYTNTLSSSEKITFNGEGIVKIKITYEQLNTIPGCIYGNKEDFFYSPEKVIVINVVDPNKAPEPTEPEPTKPEPTEPEPTKPEATEPEPTESEATEPEPTESEATEPEPTESEATEPEPTESEPTESEATEPESTEPETTDLVQNKKDVIISENNEVQIEAGCDIVPEGTILIANVITEEKELDIVTESLKGVAEKFCAFDISLENDNVKIQPNGKVKVTITIPTGYDKNKVVVYYIDNKNTNERLSSIVSGNKITFETEHFSTYVIAEDMSNSDTVDKENNSSSARWIIPVGVGIVVLLIGGVCVYIFIIRKK